MKIIYLHINDMIFNGKKNRQIFLIYSGVSYLCIIKTGQLVEKFWKFFK